MAPMWEPQDSTDVVLDGNGTERAQRGPAEQWAPNRRIQMPLRVKVRWVTPLGAVIASMS
jgi:hypothetical protein